MGGVFVGCVERVDAEEFYGLVDEDGGDDFCAGCADGFFHFAKVALELLKLGFADGEFCGAEQAFFGGAEGWEGEEFIWKPERPLFVGALGGVYGALFGGFALELFIKVGERGVDLIVVGVVKREGFFLHRRTEGAGHLDEAEFFDGCADGVKGVAPPGTDEEQGAVGALGISPAHTGAEGEVADAAEFIGRLRGICVVR